MIEQILKFDVEFIHHDDGKLEANAIRVVDNKLMGQVVISDDQGDEEHVRHLLKFFLHEYWRRHRFDKGFIRIVFPFKEETK